MSSICVVGEAFVDQYFIGEATRLSPEFPGPVVKVAKVETCLGGAANVVANLQALGHIALSLYQASTAWPYKNRLMVGNTQIARWDQNDEIPPFNLNYIRASAKVLRNADGIIFSDYAKGAFSTEAVAELRHLIPSDIPVFIDTKHSPLHFEAFDPQAIFFPNNKEWEEFRYEYRQFTSVHKHGAHGMTFVRPYPSLNNYHVAAKKVVPVSVNGAGDTVIAAFAYRYLQPTIYVDAVNVQRSTVALKFANAAAAVVVQKPLTATATLEEIERESNSF